MKFRSTIAALVTVIGISVPMLGADIQGSQTAPKVVVFSGDNVIPQVVDGGGWKTTFKFVNLENHTVSFKLSFFQDNGSTLALPVLSNGLLTAGTYTSITFTMLAAQSTTVESAALGSNVVQGWALMQRNVITDSIGGLAIFRQRVSGIPDQEATIPIVNQFSGHFVLLFDNTAFITGIAIANPTSSSVSIPVFIRNEAGTIIDQKFIALGPLAHTAFAVPSMWPSTAGIAGGIEFPHEWLWRWRTWIALQWVRVHIIRRS